MDSRIVKVGFNRSGCTSKSMSAGIRLPITWVREMGLTQEDRAVEISFVDGKIIIEKVGK